MSTESEQNSGFVKIDGSNKIGIFPVLNAKPSFIIHNENKTLLKIDYYGNVECDDVVSATQAGQTFVESIRDHYQESIDVALRSLPEHWMLVNLGQQPNDDSWVVTLEFIDHHKRSLSRVSGRGNSACDAIRDAITSANAVEFQTKYMVRSSAVDCNEPLDEDIINDHPHG